MWVYCGNVRPPDMAEWPDWMVHDYCMGIDVWSRDLDESDEPEAPKVTCEAQCQTDFWEPTREQSQPLARPEPRPRTGMCPPTPPAPDISVP